MKGYHQVAECEACGNEYIALTSTAKYCLDCRKTVHADKMKALATGPYQKQKTCECCGDNFTAKVATQKFCGECRANGNAAKHAAELRRVKQRKPPEGRYVYLWFDGDKVFYVGKGTGKRAWERHQTEDGQDAYCERLRQLSKNFRVVIIRDGLTDIGADLVESVLIEVVNPLGNQKPGSSRRVSGPVTLYELQQHLEAL